ncbi:unnamed protein product [Schistosoma turkestanicum]|nr:unnamed protein product [Schistosoma turkestanicum]
MKSSHTIYFINLIFFINCALTFNPIVLRDNTRENEIVCKDFLLNYIQLGYKLSLQLSKGREYFDLNENYQLITSRTIDRDKLCLESRLCCPYEGPTTTITATSTISSNIAPLGLNNFKDYQYNYLSYPTSSNNIHGLPTQSFYYSNLCSAKMHDTKSLFNPMCTFNLTVSVIKSPADVPDTHQITIIICDENDHVPQFKHTKENLKLPSGQNGFPESSDGQPILITNLSEASPVGSRIVLPLAEDLDSSPLNIQRYELENIDHLVNSESDLQMFQLNYTKNIVTNSDGRYPSNSIDHVSNDRTESFISKLELVLLKPLNREEKDEYKFRILAIDGGQPSQTGTLYLFIHVLDINDHSPVFNQSVYEVHISEGIINKTILQLSATDADTGENAVIIYKFPKSSEWITSTSSLPISNDLRNVNQYPPGYWFHLDDLTGRLSIHRPLDYETKSEHIFEVLAYNPPSVLSSSNHRISSDMTATATVIVKVDNEYDEPPLIQIDYSNEKNEQYKHVTENSMNLYFIAFIIVTDPDHNDDNNYHLHSSSSSSFSSSSSMSLNRVNSVSSSNIVFISCKLETHNEFYSLFESDNYKLNKINEVRYALQTIKSLDRELNNENKIVISCTDSDIPPKTSTATVLVKIDDQNDCIPEIHVSTISLSAIKIHNTDKLQQQQQQQQHYIPIQPWSMKKLTHFLDSEQDKHKVYNSPIFLAFLANISVYTVYVAENRPSSTLVARLNAIDNDFGENGRVTFEMLQSYSFNNLSSKLNYSPQLQKILLSQQTDNNNNNNHNHNINDNDVIEIQTKQEAFDLFQINTTNGDLTTRQLIDREENGIILNEVFILVEATDHGVPYQLHSFVLLQVIILDENDNPPRIISTGPTFNIEENQPAGTKIGEVSVIDPDIFSFTQLGDIYHSGLLDKQTDDYFGQFYHFMGTKSPSSSSSTLQKQQQQHHKGLQVRIDPGHGRRDLPFILHEIGNGRYFLNTTRPLDRETEEAFQFNIIASDNEPVRMHHDLKSNYPIAQIVNNHRYPGHTVSLSVIVNVIDVNDNRPEIIFPNPITSNSTIHRLSYRVNAGHEIISINANDRDADKFNGKFHFEMIQDLKSSDLFTIDRDNGMLKTRRTLTKDDLGEYQVHIIVRDEGEPSLETQLLLRLLIDHSEPQWSSDIKTSRNYQFNDFLSSSNQKHSSSHTIKNNFGLFDRNRHELYTSGNDLSTSSLFKNLDSNVLLFIVITIILFFILIMIGLCIYLRHKYNFMHFIPDVYDNKCLCCSTCLLPRRNQSKLSSNNSEKPYSKNLLDHAVITTTTSNITTTMTANCNNKTPITLTNATTTLKQLENMDHVDYGMCTDLLKYRQTNFKLGSLTPVSPIHSVVHLPISQQQQQQQQHCLITNRQHCRNIDNQEFSMDSDMSNFLVTDNAGSFGNFFSPSLSNYGSNDFSRKHASSVISNTRRCGPRNPLTVNIPDIVNETTDTIHGSYYQFVPNSLGVEFSNQSKNNSYHGFKPGNGLLHTYNIGEQQQRHVSNGRLGYINQFNEKSNAHFVPINTWDVSEFEFRPIKDAVNSYQTVTLTESGKSDDYVKPPVHRMLIPDNDQYIGNSNSVCYPQHTSHLSVWKSDPYLNQSMNDLMMKQNSKESSQLLTETNYYNKIGSTLDGINIMPEYYGTQLKRSKSTRYTTDKCLNSIKLQNKTVPFDSDFNNGDQSSKPSMMITVHPSSDKEDKNNKVTSGFSESNSTTAHVNCTKTNKLSHYAVSFPTVQASFV